MFLIVFYVMAIAILILYFTDWLKRRSMEWIVYLLAVATFPAVIFLKVAPFIWSIVDAVSAHMNQI